MNNINIHHTKIRNYLDKLLIVFIVVALSRIVFDAYFPTMPNIAEDFGISYSSVELSITAYLIGMTIFQLFWGPLSDYIGRRLTLIFSLSIFSLGGAMCFFAQEYYILIIGRFFSGIGMSAVPCMRQAIIADMFDDKITISKISGKISSFGMIVTAIAPFIGGLLFDLSNSWRAIFMINTLLAIVIILYCIFAIKESKKHKHQFQGFYNSYLSFAKIIRNKNFTIYSFLYSIVFANMLVLFQITPKVLIEYNFESATSIGLFSTLVVVNYIIAGLIIEKINFKDNYNILNFGFIFLIIGSALGFSFLIIDKNILALLIFSISIIIMSIRWLLGSIFAEAIIDIEKTGYASALIGFMQFAFSSCVSLIYAFLDVNELQTFTLSFLFIGTISLTLIKTTQRSLQKT